MPDRIFDNNLELHDQAEALRQEYGASNGGDSSEEGSAPDQEDLQEWDAGDDHKPVPPRGWLLGHTYCRRFLSGLIGDGAVGKTALRIAQLLSLASGRSLTGERVYRRCRVLLVSLEDDADELRRRVRAAMLKHDVNHEDVKGWLFLTARKGLKLIEKSTNGAEQIGKLESLLRATIKKRSIDVVCLDPFVKTHGLDENDNSAIDRVCDALTNIAIECDCAVDAPHHVSKGHGTAIAGDANRGRGASAHKNAGRLLYTLAAMSKDERELFGIAEADARRLVRLDSAKVNIAPPDTARWFRLVGVPLENGTEEYPDGDEVQTVEPWTPPNMWAKITPALSNEILDEIEKGTEEGQRYSAAAQAGEERAAWRLIKSRLPDLTEKQCKTVISGWVDKGMLETSPYDDPKTRKENKGLFVKKRPGEPD